MKKPGIGNLILGVVLFVVGIVITVVSYTSAEPGEEYTLWWGLMAAGAVTFVVGLVQFIKGENKE